MPGAQRSRGPAGPAVALDVGHLEELAGELVEASVAPSTARVYASGQRRFLAFCGGAGVGVPFPVTERVLCLFVAHLADGGLKHSTIKGYLSAVRRLHIIQDFGDPFVASLPLLDCAVKGVKLRQARSPSSRPQPRLPITPRLLRVMRDFWEGDRCNPDNVMLWAACCTCFLGFLRSGEITVPSLQAYDSDGHLSVGDVALDSLSAPSVCQVHIKASKTDPFRKGVLVYLGASGDRLCPVAALAAYLVVRGQSPGPFFRFASGVPLSREVLVTRVRAALRPSGVDMSQYSGHSFRIGAATTAAAVGIEDSLIKTLGRWESSAYLLYVRVPRERLAGVARLLTAAT